MPALALLALLGFVIFYAVAFVRMYRSTHAYEQASRWIFANVPPGSKISGPHWDDRLPLTLPGLDAHRYVFEGQGRELLLYERDTREKLTLLLNRVASTDYIVFATPRLPDSIPRIPDEYPQTTAFLQLLYKGELGYKLEKVFKPRPTLFGITFNDDLADESFSVYDHPKVTIFKNVQHLSPSEMEDRILNVDRFQPLPSLDEILLAEDSGLQMRSTGPSNGWFDAIILIVLVELLSLSAFVIVAPYFRFAPDRGAGASFVIGPFFAAWLAWIFPSMGVGTVTTAFSRIVVIAFIAVAATLVARRSDVRRVVSDTLKGNGRYAHAVFLSVTGAYLVIRSLNPEIFWGEKCMDATFLNFFIRNESFPPQDPWAAGHPMQYYYFGSYVFGWLCKVAGVAGSVGYNVAMAIVAGTACAALYSLFARLIAPGRAAVTVAVVLVSVSNFEVLRLVLWEGRPISFDTFWASTRLLTPHSFTEYPLWSLLFGDLHAHVIAIPVACAALFLASAIPEMVAQLKRCDTDSSECSCANHGVFWGTLGFVLGLMWATNSWDFLSYAVVLSVLGVSSLASTATAGALPTRLVVGRCAGAAAMTAIGAAAVAVPHFIGSGRSSGLNFNFIWPSPNEPIFNTVSQLFWLWGHWFLLSLMAAFGLRRFVTNASGFSLVQKILGGVALALPLILLATMAYAGVRPLPYQLPALALLIIAFGLFVPVRGAVGDFVRTLFVSGGILLSLSETFIISDRMNTVFKVYSVLWIIFGVGALSLLGGELVRSTERKQLKVIKALAVAVLLPILAGAVIDAVGIIRMERVPRVWGTLDGSRYLSKSAPDDAKIISWMNSNVVGTPSMVEAQGPSYSRFTRVAMHTGLPTLLGWEHHVGQRGLPPTDLEQRKRAVEAIYSSADADEAYRLLLQYGIELIVVGPLERETYPAPGLAKFDARTDLFQKVFETERGGVYAAAFSKLWPHGDPVPTVE